ncbi:MAG: hypothetical protein AAGC60_25200 [Acidobacteriota bacterium]
MHRADTVLAASILGVVALVLGGCASSGPGPGAPLVEMRYESSWSTAGGWTLELAGDGLVRLQPRARTATSFQLDPGTMERLRDAVEALRIGRRSGVSSPGDDDDLALMVLRTGAGFAEVRIEAPRRARCTGALERVAPVWNTLVAAARPHFEGRGDTLVILCDGARLR